MAQSVISLIWHIFLMIAALTAVGIVGVLLFLWKMNKAQDQHFGAAKDRFNARASRVEKSIDDARKRQQ